MHTPIRRPSGPQKISCACLKGSSKEIAIPINRDTSAPTRTATSGPRLLSPGPADVPMNEKHYAYMRDLVPLRCRHVVQGDVLVRRFLDKRRERDDGAMRGNDPMAEWMSRSESCWRKVREDPSRPKRTRCKVISDEGRQLE